ncbi:Ig-like domain-containing protein, partial [Flavobacteriaceae bacterium]|nr:Ig-like domain-containing protein [Flavobacteriaceae bacterium]
PAGGIIFYDKGDWTDDWRYLEVWTSDESDRSYGCHFEHATTDAIGGGYLNSKLMNDSCNEYNKSLYMVHRNGKRGWHIPNKDESDELYDFKLNYSNIDLNLSSDWYWTSSDKRDVYAYAHQIHYGNGSTRVEGMQYSHSIRLIRQVTIDDVQERTNKSLHLDGNTFFTINNTGTYQAINQGFYRSIGFWIYPKETGDIMAMYENHNSTDSDFLIRYNGTDNKIEFIGDGTSANGNYYASFGDLPENQWHHVYMVINNGTADYDDYSGVDIGTLYAWVNGVRQTFSENNSNKIGVSVSNNTSYLPIYVGGFENAVSTFEGYIDDLAIWGQIGTVRGMSTSEVNSIYSYPPIEHQTRLNTGFDFNTNDGTTIYTLNPNQDNDLVGSQSFTLNSEVPYTYDYKPLNLGFDYSDFVYNEFIQVTQDLGDSFLVGSINVFDPNSDSSEITLSLDETYGDVDDFNMVGNNLYFDESPPAVAYSIRVVATDAQSNSFEKILQINVTEPTNYAPVATAQTDVAADEQAVVTITLAGTDADSDPLTYIISTLPTNGTLSDNGTVITADDLPKTLSSADVAYVSSSDSATSDSFTFKVNDGTVDSEAATVSLAIAAVNDAPVATPQTDVAATEQNAVTITLAGLDPDLTTPVIFKIISLPSNGTLSDDGTVITADDLPLTLTNASGEVDYVSTSDTATSDSFTFIVNDGTVDSEAATVSLAIAAVNDVPVATAQTDVAATEQTEVTITLVGTDAESDAITFIVSTLPTNGTLSDNGTVITADDLPKTTTSSDVVYVSTSDIATSDSFTFKVNDGSEDSEAATIGIAIATVNDVPVASAQTDVAATEQTALTLTLAGADLDNDTLSYVIQTLPTNGTLSDNGTVITADDLPKTTTSTDLIYVSTSDTATSDSFTFIVNDGTVDSEAATISLAITAVNDVPVATAQTDVAATEQTEVTITLVGTDAESDAITFIVSTLPTNGTLSDNGTVITADDLPKTTTSSDVVYVSTSDIATSDSFTFKVNDGSEDSEAATVSLAITAVNDEPTKVNLSSLTIDENAAATEIGTLSTDDLDTNDTFTYELVSGEGDTDNSLFTIETDKIKNNDAFDFETKSSYSLRIKSTDSGSASIEGVFAITVNNINDISISSEITSTYCDGSDAVGAISIVTNNTNGEVVYSWTGPNGFSSTDQNLTGLESGNYELTVKDDSFEKSIEIVVEKTEIFNELSVCYVTTDSDDFTKNRIFLSYQDIYNDKKYEILREGSEAGVYEKIGEIDSGESSFLDTSSNNSSSSYSYKVRLVDNCDVVSSESSGHRTILLQSSLAVDNSVNLNWNSYEGVNYSTYKIYRRVNNGNFEELTAISSTNNSYNDTEADVTQNAYAYYVSIAIQNCNTTQKTGAKENLSNNFRYTSRANETTEIKSNQKFIQDDNADYDNDGVLNAVDSCLDTPEGSIVDVNG